MSEEIILTHGLMRDVAFNSLAGPHYFIIMNIIKIWNDGRIEKLEGFTTEDEVSIKFLQCLVDNMPGFKRMLQESK